MNATNATDAAIFEAALIDATDGCEIEMRCANGGVIVDADDDRRELAHFLVREDGSAMAW